jgi:predicted dehydrogenase
MSLENEKLRWGVMGVARIATNKVIPGMQRGTWTRIDAIASRAGGKARTAAAAMKIPKAYGSYEELLADPSIEAVYIPLPNHLHVPWTIRAAEAGKHVLCEKPIGLTADEAAKLLAVRARTGVQIEEAFMVRTHPQWLRALEISRSGRIGPVRSVVGLFSYFNDDPSNVRNVAGYGGGALLDIGCYLVKTARMIIEAEPRRVCAVIDRDPAFDVDRLTSMLLDFPGGQAIGTCATQMAPGQSVVISGTRGRIEIEIPFNAPPDRPTRIFVQDNSSREEVLLDTCDQYTIQGDLFSHAVRQRRPVPYPLEDSILTMRVLDALFESGQSGEWVAMQTHP